MNLANLDARVFVLCSCANKNEIVRGKASLVSTYRHPDFVKGSDEERHATLRAGCVELDAELVRHTELMVAMKIERDRLWRTVQNTLVTRFKVSKDVETLGQKDAAMKLAEMFTPEQLAAMLENLGSQGG